MRTAAILIFNKCLYLRGRLRLTTARRLAAYMSSRALVTTTTYSYFWGQKINLSGISPAKSAADTDQIQYTWTCQGVTTFREF